jgi:hypothetical protein
VTEDQPRAVTARWCRWCDEPVTLEGSDPHLSRAVHTASGEEKCADGKRLAAPTDTDPALAAAPGTDWAMTGLGDSGVRDVASLGEITPAMLRETFPQWLIREGADGNLVAVRDGPVVLHGPKSLLRRTVSAADPTALAEQLCVQEWLDGLDAGSLAAAWRDVLAQGARP